jgi:hypothetical protein
VLQALVGAAAIVLVFEASATAAESTAPAPKSAKKPAQTPTKAKTNSSRGRGESKGSRTIKLEDEFIIEGKLEKPSAFYILKRSKPDYDWARLEATFIPLVLESVQDPLF